LGELDEQINNRRMGVGPVEEVGAQQQQPHAVARQAVPQAMPQAAARMSGLTSGRNTGLVLFLSRLLRAVWDHEICLKDAATPVLRWDSSQRAALVRLQGALASLRQFMNKDQLWRRPENIQQQADFVQEEERLASVQRLLDRAQEGLALLVALAERPNFQRGLKAQVHCLILSYLPAPISVSLSLSLCLSLPLSPPAFF
jgi:pyridoxine/pyridoxamine 5'-phosphate oxidase